VVRFTSKPVALEPISVAGTGRLRRSEASEVLCWVRPRRGGGVILVQG
jgi:hypothetical protein